MAPDALKGCTVHCVAGLLWVHASLQARTDRVRAASLDLRAGATGSKQGGQTMYQQEQQHWTR